MSTTNLQLRIQDQVAWIQIDRPTKLNALNKAEVPNIAGMPNFVCLFNITEDTFVYMAMRIGEEEYFFQKFSKGVLVTFRFSFKCLN